MEGMGLEDEVPASAGPIAAEPPSSAKPPMIASAMPHPRCSYFAAKVRRAEALTFSFGSLVTVHTLVAGPWPTHPAFGVPTTHRQSWSFSGSGSGREPRRCESPGSAAAYQCPEHTRRESLVVLDGVHIAEEEHGRPATGKAPRHEARRESCLPIITRSAQAANASPAGVVMTSHGGPDPLEFAKILRRVCLFGDPPKNLVARQNSESPTIAAACECDAAVRSSERASADSRITSLPTRYFSQLASLLARHASSLAATPAWNFALVSWKRVRRSSLASVRAPAVLLTSEIRAAADDAASVEHDLRR